MRQVQSAGPPPKPDRQLAHPMRIGSLLVDHPVVMGILNVTPDSFSDGGRFASRDAALRHAEAMLADGAEILDIGGESTRPGAADVSAGEELDRVIPVIEAMQNLSDVPVSIDTSKPAVMQQAVSAGAAMINDVRALGESGALAMAASLGVPVCLMHMRGHPRTMQHAPEYDDVTAEVRAFLAERRDAAVAAGVPQSRILLDPGFGFGKQHHHNVELLANLRQLTELGQLLLVGLSRKATLGALTGRDVGDRLAASVAAALIAVMQGVRLVRAHDVRETVDALTVWRKVKAKESME